MPLHDWTKVDAGLFHAFQHSWVSSLCNHLNDGLLPAVWYALPERAGDKADSNVQPYVEDEAVRYAALATRIAVRDSADKVVSLLLIVPPGLKTSAFELQELVQQICTAIASGVNVLLVDLFPPVESQPQGIHGAVCERTGLEDFTPPSDKRLTLASYGASAPKKACVEPVAVGDALPDMPFFLEKDRHVNLPMEQAYQSAWSKFPDALKPLLS